MELGEKNSLDWGYADACLVFEAGSLFCACHHRWVEVWVKWELKVQGQLSSDLIALEYYKLSVRAFTPNWKEFSD